MKTLLFSTTIVLLMMVGSISCQEGEGSSLMSRFKDLVKNFFNSMKDMWGEFKQELKSRSADMQNWSKEMFESFKQKMKEWIDQASGASDSEREEMRVYLEKMEMEAETSTDGDQ